MSIDNAVDTSVVVDAESTTESITQVVKPNVVEGENEHQKHPWLKSRLERTQQKVLEDLGAENIEEAKRAISEAKLQREAKKTAEQRVVELEKEASKATKKYQELQEALSIHATSKLSTLTQEQQQSIIDLAGDDPAKQIKFIDRLSATWKSSATAPATTNTEAKAKVTTLPTRSAPSGEGNPQAESPRQAYERLKAINPIQAASFAKRHPEIYKKD